MITMGAVLLAACSHDDDVTTVVTPGEPVAIAFDCSVENTEHSENPEDSKYLENTTRADNGHTGILDKEDLYYTGFGVFACQDVDGKPDLMYNQQVSFTFVGDLTSPLRGYWSYTPLKYWPSDVEDFNVCAYAPYVASPTDEGTNTGIIGISDNNTTTPYIIYRRPLHPEETVDVLWAYTNPTAIEPLVLTMHHALARLRVSITLDADSDIPVGTKVLVRRITLSSTSMAETARLALNVSGDTPSWDSHTTEARTIYIDHAPDRLAAADQEKCYGYVANDIRFIEELPYRWQPAGLQKGETVNALVTEDRPTFLYLIPQSTLSLNCRIDYTLIASDESRTDGLRRTSAAKVITPLEGNTRYEVNLKLKIN